MHILVLQLKSIGDAILTTPLLAALREHIPGCSITLAIAANTAALEQALGADRTLIFRRGAAGLAFWGELSKGGFDTCIDLTSNDRSAFATALSRAPRRITWERFAKKPLRRMVYNEFIPSSVKNRHTADHHTDLLRAFDIRIENVPLSLHLNEVVRKEAIAALAEIGIDTPFAVLHAGTARAEKYWIPERWAEVIRFLKSEFQLPVVLTGSTNTVEQAHLEAIQQFLVEPCASLAGRISFSATAAVIERARLLCAVDSAPIHIADALGTPLVALFGPTNPFHWRPRRSSSRIVTAAPDDEITPAFPKAPMSDIKTEKVIAAIRSLL